MFKVYASSYLHAGGGGVTFTEGETLDEVMDTTSHGSKTNGPKHATLDPNRTNTVLIPHQYDVLIWKIHKPFNIMTSADETILIYNCIYEDLVESGIKVFDMGYAYL